MNYSTQVEYEQALYIDELESTIDKTNNEELEADRRYAIAAARLLQVKEHKFTVKEVNKIKEQVLKLL